MKKRVYLSPLLLLIGLGLAGCDANVTVSGKRKNSTSTFLSEVTITKLSPLSSKENDPSLTMKVFALEGSLVELFTNSTCTTSVASAIASGGEAIFNLTLSAYGARSYYAKQSINGETSRCSSSGVHYTFAPPEITGLNLLFPSSPGRNNTPNIEAQGIETGAVVRLYSDSACSTLAATSNEDSNTASLTPNLIIERSYTFYGTQSINSVESKCSSVNVIYEYRASCYPEDMLGTPFARGLGTENDPYIICSPTQFNSIGSTPASWDKHFYIANNLDLSVFNETSYNIIGGTNCASNRFTGVMDGGFHVLDGLSLNSPAVSNLGVIGCFNGSFRNIQFSNISITGSNYVGLIGTSGVDDSLDTIATISNVNILSGVIQGASYIGGIAGQITNTNISDSTNGASINISASYAGGIAGHATKFSTLENNTATGNITASPTTGTKFGGIVGEVSDSILNNNTSTLNISAGEETGGLAGRALNCLEFQGNQTTITIANNNMNNLGGIAGYVSNCTLSKNTANATIGGGAFLGAGVGALFSSRVSGNRTSGTVTASDDHAGGLIGYADNSIITKNSSSATINSAGWTSGGLVGYLDVSNLSNSFFSGSISASSDHSGGVVGASSDSTTAYCYSSGTTLNQSRGFLGAVYGSNTFTNNYYIGSQAAVASTGLSSGAIESKLLSEMQLQSTFVNWNFSVTWSIAASTYPELSISRAPGTFYVSPSGNDSNPGTITQPWRTLSFAGLEAIAGDTILARGGSYDSRLLILNSGNSNDGPITFKNYGGETPVIDGSLITPSFGTIFAFIEGQDISNIVVEGFEIRDLLINDDTTDLIGIYFSGRGSNISILNNSIHDFGNEHANGNGHGILVNGTHILAKTNILIEGNELYNLKLGWSETLTLNGNVNGFAIRDNSIHDNNNIGIDIAGHYDVCLNCTAENDRARNGLITQNSIYNISSTGNPSYSTLAAVGLYVDGGKNILIERNTIYQNDFGVEFASEIAGTSHADDVTFRNNLIHNNRLAGIALGGYSSTRRGCRNCTIVQNTFFNNNTSNNFFGEVYLQHNNDSVAMKNNIFFTSTQGILIQSNYASQINLDFDYNLFFSPNSTTDFIWEGSTYGNLSAFQAASNLEVNGLHTNPLFVDASLADFNLQSTSPGVNSGLNISSTLRGTQDHSGNARSIGDGIDLGALERQSSP